MNQIIFDVHSHLQFPDYDIDRDAVIARMRAAGVKTITVGTDTQTSQQAIALAEHYPDDLWATAGIHPTDIDGFDAEKLLNLAGHKKVVAIGECGLDYFRIKDLGFKNKQKEVFEQHIEIAGKANKPLMIHCRPSKGTDDAYEDLISQMSKVKGQMSKVVHFFVGSLAVAKQLLELGCYFTFGGVITFARDYDEVIRFLPLEHILLETDAPFVAPEPYRGKRNEPAYVIEVAKKLAEIKDVAAEQVIKQTTITVKKIFDTQPFF